MSSKWHKYFLTMAEHAASLSKDTSTKVGCVIVGPDRNVLSTGFNGMPMGVDDNKPERHERPTKYKFFEHAERNAVYLAARAGTALKGSTAYIHPWPPCPDCARALIQAGIREIVVPSMDVPERWKGEVLVSCEMLLEAGVNIKTPDAPLRGEPIQPSWAACSNCKDKDAGSTSGVCQICKNYSNWRLAK